MHGFWAGKNEARRCKHSTLESRVPALDAAAAEGGISRAESVSAMHALGRALLSFAPETMTGSLQGFCVNAAAVGCCLEAPS